MDAHGIAAAAFSALAVGTAASVNALHNHTGCAPLRPRHWLAPLAIFLLAPFVFGWIYLTQSRVDWRGRVYDLDRSSRLASR